MQRKRLAVSKKGQITLPIRFVRELGIEYEVECSIDNGAILIRPARPSGGEFADIILRELVAKGLTGDDLVREFSECNRKIRPAVEAALAEADAVSSGRQPSATIEDVFGGKE